MCNSQVTIARRKTKVTFGVCERRWPENTSAFCRLRLAKTTAFAERAERRNPKFTHCVPDEAKDVCEADKATTFRASQRTSAGLLYNLRFCYHCLVWPLTCAHCTLCPATLVPVAGERDWDEWKNVRVLAGGKC